MTSNIFEVGIGARPLYYRTQSGFPALLPGAAAEHSPRSSRHDARRSWRPRSWIDGPLVHPGRLPMLSPPLFERSRPGGRESVLA